MTQDKTTSDRAPANNVLHNPTPLVATRPAAAWDSYLVPERTLDNGTRLASPVPADAPPHWPPFLVRGEAVPDVPDLARMHRANQAGVRARLAAAGYAAAVFFDPLNVVYATGVRNMAIWTSHNAARYCFIPVEGPTVLFDFHNCEYKSEGLDTVQEVRPATSWFYFMAGTGTARKAELWADEIADLMRAHGGGNRRVAFDRLDPMGLYALEARGLEVTDGQEIAEQCRARKSVDELACVRRSMQVCEAGLASLQSVLEPGVSENQAWAKLQEMNHANDGEWSETRLMSSGWRTNPWFRECSDRKIEAGELIALDTDLVGPYGMCVDISRTFLCPGAPAAPEFQTLTTLAQEQIHFNLQLLRPGITGREIAERSFRIPEAYVPNRYSSVLHGIGMADEWPAVRHHQDWQSQGAFPEIVLEEGMTVCVESYIGAAGGKAGVKLEEQVLIGADGPIVLSSYPHDAALSPPPWL